MRRLSNAARVMTVLALLATATAGGPARAAGVGITIPSIQPEPVGDPVYEYLITAELLAGNTLLPGGYFTVYDLPDITSKPLTATPDIHWGASTQLLGVTPADLSPPDSPTLWNVTFQWNGANPIVAPADSDLPLGLFIVGSTIQLSSPPTGTVVYVGSLDGTHGSNQGTVTIGAVPEPASILLLSMGAASALAGCARARRLRTRTA